MVNRRKLFATLAAPFAFLGMRKPCNAASKLPAGHEILRSFDARDWAKAFVAHVQQIPGIATDEETMVGWFANSLMRGYDEREARQSGTGTPGRRYRRKR